MDRIEEIKNIYSMIEEQIRRRMKEFRRIGMEGNDVELFSELVFCLLTPQSRARTCWKAVERMRKDGSIFNGGKEEIMKNLQGVRFRRKKAEYIILARRKFMEEKMRKIIDGWNDSFTAREWLVKNVKGMGYKEASHFLRNIGKGENLAILDRHILKNLLLLGVIDEIPSSISRRRYYDIEKKMKIFSRKIDIPLSHLDLVLWYKEAGEVFK